MDRLRLELADRLRFSPALRSALSRVYGLQSRLAGDVGVKVRCLCQALRMAGSDRRVQSLERRINWLLASRPYTTEDLLASSPDYAEKRIPKAAILKPSIGPREKGVVFISFEEQWARLLHMADLDGFAARYQLVVAPTWCPPHSLFNFAFPRLYPGPVFTTISNPLDLKYFPRICKSYIPIELYASSWVEPDLYTPVSFDEKDIDIIVISNFGLYKRHFELFKALRQLPEDLRVVLVGQPNGDRTAEVLLGEAAAYGVRDRIELKERVSNDELVDLLCRAKTSLILSLREGSCVAVVESMFAGTPIGMFEDAAIGSKVFINSQTGRLLRHRNLHQEILAFLQDAAGCQAREWVMENGVSCYDSTEKLNQALRDHAVGTGGEWTQDILPHHWRPNPILCRQEDQERMQEEQARILDQFGIVIG